MEANRPVIFRKPLYSPGPIGQREVTGYEETTVYCNVTDKGGLEKQDGDVQVGEWTTEFACREASLPHGVDETWLLTDDLGREFEIERITVPSWDRLADYRVFFGRRGDITS